MGLLFILIFYSTPTQKTLLAPRLCIASGRITHFEGGVRSARALGVSIVDMGYEVVCVSVF